MRGAVSYGFFLFSDLIIDCICEAGQSGENSSFIFDRNYSTLSCLACLDNSTSHRKRIFSNSTVKKLEK